jgi:hypothetical protein
LSKVGEIFSELGWLYSGRFRQGIGRHCLNAVLLEPLENPVIKRQPIDSFPGNDKLRHT